MKQVVDGRDKYTTINNPREDWIPVQVPAIVSEELWDAAQRRAKSNKRHARRNVKREYLMRYRLTCACGYKVQCQVSTRDCPDSSGTYRQYYKYYKCGGLHGKTVRQCDLPGFRVDQVARRFGNGYGDGCCIHGNSRKRYGRANSSAGKSWNRCVSVSGQ